MKCNRTQTWWVGRIKKKISSFYTRSQKYELFCISQQQRSRIKLCDWPTEEQSNGVEWQTACVRERRLDNLTTSLTWLQAVNGLSRENIKKMARIMPLSNMVINRGQKRRKIGVNLNGFLTEATTAPASFHSREIWENIYVNSSFWGKANSNKSPWTRDLLAF